MKIPFKVNHKEIIFQEHDYDFEYVTYDLLDDYDCSTPYSMKLFIESNKDLFTKEEIQVINDLLNSDTYENRIIAFQIIDSKPEKEDGK